jgi:toxin-antitoxin system PIN domain toxin
LIAVDTNVLVYAHQERLRKHESALRRLTELAEGHAGWAIPVFCLGEFLRVITHPRLFTPPYSADEGCVALERILASPSLTVILPGPDFPTLLSAAIREANAAGNLVFDAQVVAVCRENGVSALLTEDRDFDRFRSFRTVHLE